jgi:hypothetical protein
MVGSDAIIGVPEDGTVLKYDLDGKGSVQQVPMSTEKQTLRDTSISVQDGKTVMEFTKLLVEDGELPISEDGTNTFLHARGGSVFGYHDTRSAFEMAFDNDAVVSPAIEAEEANVDLQDCTIDFCYYELDQNYKLRYLLNEDSTTMEVILDRDEGWVAIAFSEDGAMIGSEAVM